MALLTQQDVLDQLDRLKSRNRGYMTVGSYQDFMPAAIPGLSKPADSSSLAARISSASDYSQRANELSATKAQNEREYQQLVQAQQAVQIAQRELKRAQKLKKLSAKYSGGGEATVRGRNLPIAVGSPNMLEQANAMNKAIDGQFKDNTPFNPNAGLGTYRWKNFNLTVNKSVANNFIGLLNALAKRGYKVTSLGSYANRNIAGTNTKSLHAYGLAIDINPAQNPVTWNGKNITNLPPGVKRLASKYGLAWGGAWNGEKRDPMHFSMPFNGIK